MVGRVRELKGSEHRQDDHQSDQETKVPDSIHDECFVGCGTGRLSFDVKANQQETADTDKFPENKDLEDIPCEDKSQHREAEERQVGEESMKSTRSAEVSAISQMNFVIFKFFGQFIVHVADGKQMNASGDERHHGKHQQRQTVDVPFQCQSDIPELT